LKKCTGFFHICQFDKPTCSYFFFIYLFCRNITNNLHAVHTIGRHVFSAKVRLKNKTCVLKCWFSSKLILNSKLQEREHRRNLTTEQRMQLKEQKRQKRAKAVDARSAADLTRTIITYLTKKFETSSPDVTHQFTIAELKEEFKEDRSSIASVIRIFEGLEIVERVINFVRSF